jgi:signal transduction histidine kinase
VQAIQHVLTEAKEILYDAHAFLQLRDLEGLQVATLDLAGLLRDIAASFAAEAGWRNVGLVVRAPNALPVPGSPFLRRALSNLVSNAIKYSPAGSTVTVEIEEGPPVRVAVRNRGERIPVESRERIFERFVRRGRQGIKGVGLGLAIVRRIAELLGGRTWVEDDPAGGCVFFFELPPRPPGQAALGG